MAERTAGFHTLGCKVNRYETDAVMQRFVNAGYKVLGFDEVCDVYVINTCTVTGEAARKSGQFIRRARKLNPHAVVIAMG
ncbi:MAG: tRNA (N(6)-L-threonylcarbamoyladenosine(37)-C(2))-methylthiotransferase MtaB, partial [Eubacteriales bacterium]|nr:tRNA (N(6)-L-threonylcarbamoyladenosine(37)-C(2))-methylthiotransferase MtaB [Eubacteriales bacterium]